MTQIDDGRNDTESRLLLTALTLSHGRI